MKVRYLAGLLILAVAATSPALAMSQHLVELNGTFYWTMPDDGAEVLWHGTNESDAAPLLGSHFDEAWLPRYWASTVAALEDRLVF